jgi:hypothetical protein
MNFHLIFVHFPIALFTIYALLELVSVKKLRELSYWFYIKALMVIVGAGSAFVTLQTGEAIENKFRYLRALVEIHSSWATTSTIVFSVIATAYAIVWINSQWHLEQRTIRYFSTVWALVTKLSVFMLKRWVVFILALFGLVAISITGALGGAISQGPDIDPVVNFVYHLYFAK